MEMKNVVTHFKKVSRERSGIIYEKVRNKIKYIIAFN